MPRRARHRPHPTGSTMNLRSKRIHTLPHPPAPHADAPPAPRHGPAPRPAYRGPVSPHPKRAHGVVRPLSTAHPTLGLAPRVSPVFRERDLASPRGSRISTRPRIAPRSPQPSASSAVGPMRRPYPPGLVAPEHATEADLKRQSLTDAHPPSRSFPSSLSAHASHGLYALLCERVSVQG